MNPKLLDPPFAVTDDETFIRPIMAAMGFPDSVFDPPTSGNRVIVMFVLPAIDEIAPHRYACFLAEHFHTNPDENGYILTTLSSTHFTPTDAAKFFAEALHHTSPINDAKMPPAPPAHIISRN
jgi:hypothetical protein